MVRKKNSGCLCGVEIDWGRALGNFLVGESSFIFVDLAGGGGISIFQNSWNGILGAFHCA